MRSGEAMQTEVLAFWFDEIDPKSWWSAEPAFDETVRKRFAETLRAASRCELSDWRETARGRLAEIIVLDQFSRNIHRDSPLAFAQDALALALAQEAVRREVHLALSPVERGFLFLPYMHSESARIHETAEALYLAHGLPENLDFERRHRAIIERFGRYPHRNAVLGRASTAEEQAFLQQPGSSF
ncbi:MAG TPA: DUF924 family protein [Fontimonas sp.]